MRHDTAEDCLKCILPRYQIAISRRTEARGSILKARVALRSLLSGLSESQEAL
jgi:hypothetical protein